MIDAKQEALGFILGVGVGGRDGVKEGVFIYHCIFFDVIKKIYLVFI